MKSVRISRLINILASLAMLLAWTSLPASAAPQLAMTVTANNDMADALPGDGICETVAGNGMCTLRAAIMEANAHVGEDTVNLPTGTYNLSLAGQDEDQGATGDLDITDRLILQGTGGTNPVIDAQWIDRAIDITSSATEVTLYRVQIRNGSTSGDGGGIYNRAILHLDEVQLYLNETDRNGGAIYSNGFQLTLQAGSIHANTARIAGGGIYSYSDIEATWPTITDNHSRGDGGGLYLQIYSDVQITGGILADNAADVDGGGIYTLGPLAMDLAQVVENSAGENGGGMYVSASGVVTLTEDTFDSNEAQSGGGVYIASDGQLDGQDMLFNFNSAVDEGGAVANFGEGSLIESTLSNNSAATGGAIAARLGFFGVQASTIISNTASLNGGGIANTTEMALKRVTLTENHADNGGGINNLGSMRIENSTISRNTARNHGGGIFNGFYTYLYNATITSNTAGTGLPSSGVGGGIYGQENEYIQFRNTIVYGNHHRRLTNFIDDDCYGMLTSADYNLVGTSRDCTVVGLAGHNLTGVDPQLGELADNGGPTQTQALPEGSPAVDAANPEGCLTFPEVLLTTDQREEQREVDGDGDGVARCDIGAYELDPFIYLFLPVTRRP